MIVHFLEAVVAFILVLGPLVFIHELGHFAAAKMFKIGVPVFSLGFGPRLFGFRRRETDYRLSAIPLGGYVRMAGDEADEERTGAPDEFLSRPKWQRFIVFVAGPAFNVVLAFAALWLLFGVYGKDEVPDRYPAVVSVSEGSPAEAAGIVAGDLILEIAGRDIESAVALRDTYNLEVLLSPNADKALLVDRAGEKIPLTVNTGADPTYGWGDPGWSLSLGPAVVLQVLPGEAGDEAGLRVGDRVVAAGDRAPISEIELRLLLKASPETPVPLTVERDGEQVALTVVPRLVEGGGRIGVDLGLDRAIHRSLSVMEAAGESWNTNVANSKMLFVVLKRLVTREVPLRSMSGPIGIAQFARQALVAGPATFLLLLGFFSLQLGILNLLPIPVLDGGHILILFVEGSLRRDLSEKVKERVMQAGFLFLVAFMSVIIYLDVVKSF